MYSSPATTAFKSFHGVVCLYKPAEVSIKYIKHTLASNMCKDFNALDIRTPINYLDVKRSSESEIIVNVRPSYADNALAIGPRFELKDFKMFITPLPVKSSGVCRLNKGAMVAAEIMKANPLKTVQVGVKLGSATRFMFKDTKVVGKASFKFIKKNTLDTILASFQAAHQKKIFSSLGVHLQSQEAYDLILKGSIKPPRDIPAIYSMKCIDFDLPSFSLELVCANETEDYILRLVHDLGLQLKTFAHVTGLRYIRYGPFTIKHSLLQKQWTLNHLINNMEQCSIILNASNLLNDTIQDVPESSATSVKNV